MGKGMKPKQGYNQKKYEENYEGIDWSRTRDKKITNAVHSPEELKKVQRRK
jgi:hypothetical protein